MSKTINNINDLAEYLGTSVEHLRHDVYKYTACGAWIDWDNEQVTFGSIVEGSDAEFCYTLLFPFSSNEYEANMKDLEDMVDFAWREANNYEEW